MSPTRPRIDWPYRLAVATVIAVVWLIFWAWARGDALKATLMWLIVMTPFAYGAWSRRR